MTHRIIDTSLERFEFEVLQASFECPVMVDFWADWCSPCLVIEPLIKQVIQDWPDPIRLAKLEVDEGENMKLAGRYRVRGFPTVILFQNGIEKGRFSSARPARFIEQFIQEHCE